FDNAGDFAADAKLRPQLAPLLDGAGPVDFRLWPIRRDRTPWRWCRLIGIARQVAILKHDRLQVIAVRAHEAVAPTIEAHPVLPAAGRSNDLTRFWIERKITAAKLRAAGRIERCPVATR